MIPTLADFLLARIAEDKRLAQTIQAQGRWSWREFPAGVHSLGDDNAWAPYFSAELSGGVVFPTASVLAHVVRWDPARILLELEAKRKILDRWKETAPTDSPIGCGWPDARTQEIYETLTDEVLPYLALPYADHPDYQEAWRP